MKTTATHPVILYDGTCRLCRRWAARLVRVIRRRGFRLTALQSTAGRRIVAVASDEMKVFTRDRRVLGGAAGIAYVAQFIWWGKPIHWLWQIPALRPLFHRVYRHIAAHRHCATASCGALPNRGVDAAQERRWTTETRRRAATKGHKGEGNGPQMNTTGLGAAEPQPQRRSKHEATKRPRITKEINHRAAERNSEATTDDVN